MYTQKHEKTLQRKVTDIEYQTYRHFTAKVKNQLEAHDYSHAACHVTNLLNSVSLDCIQLLPSDNVLGQRDCVQLQYLFFPT